MTRYAIEICHRRAPLPEHWTLMDVAYIYAWKRVYHIVHFLLSDVLNKSFPCFTISILSFQNAPMRFFYRVALEEQTLEAPSHDRPSTPGLGASLPPVDTGDVTRSNAIAESPANDAKSRTEADRSANTGKVVVSADEKDVAMDKSCSPADRMLASKGNVVNAKEEQQSGSIATSAAATSITVSIATTNPTSTTTTTNTVALATSSEANKQVKTPIKILKNSEGRYEVLRSPPGSWTAKEQNIVNAETKLPNPEFSVVSIGSGQNSNGVKITLKQCTPNNVSPKKPKVISNVLLHCGQLDKDSSGSLVLEQFQRDREKQQAEKNEKPKRKVTFVERPSPEKTTASNVLKAVQKKGGEQQEKKQFLQGFQLTARESIPDVPLEITPKSNELHASNRGIDIESKTNESPKEGDDATAETSSNADESKDKSNGGHIEVNASGSVASANKRIAIISGNNSNARVNTNKQCGDVEACTFGYSKSTIAMVNANANGSPTKVDVYTFPNDPSPVVPAGAVKRKCPPGLPIFDIKRKKQQQIQTQATKKTSAATSASVVQTKVKSSRKSAPEQAIPGKRTANMVGEAGPSRVPGIPAAPPAPAAPTTPTAPTAPTTPTTPTLKPPSSPVLSNDTRNILDGCGLNIPASLSITLTAPKSPGSSGGFVEIADSKDNRKSTVGKVSPSITLNDRSVDPRVLKALKAGQIRMPAAPKPRQTKQTERDTNQPRSVSAGKRKREQESRDILDLSGGKKVDIHPLRIPQPVTKIRPKPTIRNSMPNISEQGQLVTLVGGHRYYRAPPGSLTPAAHRVTDCPLPTPSRAPVYAPGLSSSLNSSRTTTSLSSVFPSLQSLYALSQAPNLQQFQMDAR